MNVTSTTQLATPFSLGLMLTLALVAMAGFVLLRWISGRPIPTARRIGLLAIRLVVLATLALIIANPVRVEKTPGAIEFPKLLYLLDTSQSMAIGKGATRWEQVLNVIRQAGGDRDPRASATISLFRFGSRLAAVDAGFARPDEAAPPPRGEPGVVLAAGPSMPAEQPPAPTDPDTLLGESLEGITDRFGPVPPQALVVFSDGRTRDADRAERIARAYARMKLPVHVFPVGDENVGGDVAIVGMVAPNSVRKYSKVSAQVFVRCYGYQSKRSELKIVAKGAVGKPEAVLARTPVVFEEGLTSYSLAFETGDEDRRIEARIDPQPGEVSVANNAFGADMAIDHTKIRVLYLEGQIDSYVAQRLQSNRGGEAAAAFPGLQQTLMEDPDVECTAFGPGQSGGDFSSLAKIDEQWRRLPDNASQLFAYDAIVLSNVPRDVLSDQQLAWIEEWIGRRGAGLCMVGGPNSFASGRWNGTSVGQMLPVELLPAARDWDDARVGLHVTAAGENHPVWHLSSDEAQNRSTLKALPSFTGSNRFRRAKPGADVLAQTNSFGAAGESPCAVVVQPFGRGRAMAMCTAITRRWAGEVTQPSGGRDVRYYKKFWRNVVYWLTENSSIGRRRLLAETDKRLYRPGEPIILRARTFDENAAPTLDYRVAVTIEPSSASDVTADNSPLIRPAAGPKASGAQAPLLPWSEEFELVREASDKSYGAILPIAEAKSLPVGATLTQGLRIELTAYEDNTQVDSTSLEVQVLDDPSEQQNPLPDHDLLRRIASASGGTVLKDAIDLNAMIEKLPRLTGSPEIKTTPAWSVWWLLALLIALLTIEWAWRRRLGMA